MVRFSPITFVLALLVVGCGGHPKVSEEEILSAYKKGPDRGWVLWGKGKNYSTKITKQFIDGDFAVVTFVGQYLAEGYDLGAGVFEPDKQVITPCESLFHWEAGWVLRKTECRVVSL